MSSHIEPGMDQIIGQLDLCSLYPYYSFLFLQETRDEVDTSQASEDDVNEVYYYNFTNLKVSSFSSKFIRPYILGGRSK